MRIGNPGLPPGDFLGAGHFQALTLFHAYGLKSVCLRYFNAAGADPDGEIGEWHEPETHLISILFQVASGMRSRASIYGTDYTTHDGTSIRDYVHLMDLCDAHILALDYLHNYKLSGRLTWAIIIAFLLRK